MISFRRAAGGLLHGAGRALGAGTLAGVIVLGGVGTSCSSSKPAAVERDGEADTVAALTGTTRRSPAAATVRAECTECHPRIHDAVLGRGPVASQACSGCHAAVHDTIQALYAGTMRAGAAVRPDPMFAERVRCAGCHVDSTFAAPAGARRAAALDGACTSCHGRTFAGMVSRWTSGLAWRQRAVSGYVDRAAADQRLGERESLVRVRSAQQAVHLVTAAGGVHNVRGADALFRAALDSVAAAYRLAHLPVPDRPALGPDAARVACVGCHYGIEASRVTAFGQSFDHEPHVVRANVACTKCHGDADYLVAGRHEVDRRHGRTTITAAACEQCHHAAASTVACVTCHTGDGRLAKPLAVTLPLRLKATNAPTSRAVTFSHLDHPDVACASCHTTRATPTAVAACATCHDGHHREGAGCAKCHGSEIRIAHTAADHLACARCHARETVALLTPTRAFCVTCHADRVDHKGGKECSTCHMQSTPSELRQRILRAPPPR